MDQIRDGEPARSRTENQQIKSSISPIGSRPPPSAPSEFPSKSIRQRPPTFAPILPLGGQLGGQIPAGHRLRKSCAELVVGAVESAPCARWRSRLGDCCCC